MKIVIVAAVRNFCTGVFMYVCVKDKFSAFLSVFTPVNEAPYRGTKSRNKIYVSNLVMFRWGLSLVFRGAKLW